MPGAAPPGSEHQIQCEREGLFEICRCYRRKQKYLLASSAQSWHAIQTESHIGKFSTDGKIQPPSVIQGKGLQISQVPMKSQGQRSSEPQQCAHTFSVPSSAYLRVCCLSLLTLLSSLPKITLPSPSTSWASHLMPPANTPAICHVYLR